MISQIVISKNRLKSFLHIVFIPPNPFDVFFHGTSFKQGKIDILFCLLVFNNYNKDIVDQNKWML